MSMSYGLTEKQAKILAAHRENPDMSDAELGREIDVSGSYVDDVLKDFGVREESGEKEQALEVYEGQMDPLDEDEWKRVVRYAIENDDFEIGRKVLEYIEEED